jgi:dihydropteroate synthase
MQLYRLDINDPKAFLSSLGVEGNGITIIEKKMELFFIYIKELKTPAVNILKQDALSIGAELAVPSGAITNSKTHYDCLLIGNKKHIEILSHKELAQPFGLKEVARQFKSFLHTKVYPTEIMGIINANDDSFYSASRFDNASAIIEIESMITNGANIIDIGAVSSRPNAAIVSSEEEMERVKAICDTIKSQKLYEKVTFSIDSYTPTVVEYALESGFKIVNDITGANDDRLIELAIKYDARLCIMHMQGTPQTMQKNPIYSDVMSEVNDFFEARIAKCEAFGLARENIILDIGIGFGKTLEHNITLIKNMRHFTKFGCQILAGASRKSIIDKIIPTPIEERLAGTLAVHLKALENGASIIRCHDVKKHKQAIEVYKTLS